MKSTSKKHLKKWSRKGVSFMLAAALLLGLFQGKGYGFIQAEEKEPAKMKDKNLMVNDYVGLFVNDAGRFSIGTTGGNPENDGDNNQRLLCGYSISSTSYTTFCINGTAYQYEGQKGEFDTDSAQHISESDNHGIHIEQRLSFCKNSATGREDVVETKYIVTNTSEEEKSVGCRIMFDTQLGPNDHAPFRIPGYGAVTTETEFEGEDIPQIWQAFDNLSNPGVIAQGRFFKSKKDRPDKVQFANWGRLSDTSWDMKINKGSRNGDSGVAATWYEEPLTPGETREYKTYYGLSDLAQDLTGPLILSVYAESELEVLNNSYAPNPFPVNAFIENVGAETIEGVCVRLELPEGLSFAEGSQEKMDIGEMKTGVMVQKNWQVKAKPSASEQYYKMKIVLDYGNGETKSVTRTVHVPVLKRRAVPKALQYTLFSESSEKPLSMYGWQSYVTGNIYSGNDYIYQGSILGITGRVDTRGVVSTSGWQMNIDEVNEAHEPVEMSNLDGDIIKKAGDTENFDGSKNFTEDTMVLEKSLCAQKDISFAGTVFSGSGYIIAGQNITCNLNQGSTYNDGRVVMYARQGDITLNGSEIALDGILYAPNGTVYVNANIFRLRGRIIAGHIVMNTSQNYIEGDESDISYIYDAGYEEEEPEKKGFYEKTFSEEEIAQEMSEEGTWTMVCDAGAQDTDWRHVTWNGVRPDDSDIQVTVAAGDDGENYSEAVSVSNGTELEGVHGRYLEVKVQLHKASSEILPRLIDLTVSTENGDLITNMAPVLNLQNHVYETEAGKPVTVILGSRDDAAGDRSSYQLVLNAEEDGQEEAVEIEKISAVSRQVTIQKSGVYDFTASVTDGEFHAEQMITVIVREPEEEPGTGGEQQQYQVLAQIEGIEFNEDFSSLQIIGTASAQGHLKNYKLSYGKEEEDNMQMLGEKEQEVENGVLGTIPTEGLEAGSYILILIVEDENGNICQCRGRFELSTEQLEPEKPEKPEQPEQPEEPEPPGQQERLTEEELAALKAAKQSAVEWLKAQADETGLWQGNGLMNTTCNALAVLRAAGEEIESAAFMAWLDGGAGSNIDDLCHAVWGNPDTERMKAIWEQQNTDGGFGLTEDYTSDLYDTLLVLMTEAYMQDVGYPAVESAKLTNALNYIASHRNADGGFGYNQKDASRIALTAEYVAILNKLGLEITGDNTPQTYCVGKYTSDFSENMFLEQAVLARALRPSASLSQKKETIQKILSVQQENGSIYNDVEDTMLFIILSDEMIKGEE